MFIRLFSLWVGSGFNYLHEDIQLQQWRQNLTFTHTDCIKPFLNETNVCDGMITQFGGENKENTRCQLRHLDYRSAGQQEEH